MSKLIFKCVVLVFLFGCNYSNDKGFKTNNSSRLIKFDNQSIQTNSSFDVSSISKANDTLTIITCSKYMYYPFGTIDNAKQIKASLLKDFIWIDKKYPKQKNVSYDYQLLKYKSSKLALYFDTFPKIEITSYVTIGIVLDNDVEFINHLSIGMTKKDFLKLFFDSFPDGLFKRYNVIIFRSCKIYIWQTYNFKNDILNSVKFESAENVCDLNF